VPSTMRPAPTVATPSLARGLRPGKRPIVAVLVAALTLGLTAVAGIAPLLSPAGAGMDTIDEFSLSSARDDLAVVAAAPHPMGSAEQLSVEAYLVRELTEIGLDPQVDVQTVTMAPDPPNSVWTGTVRNIVARLEGTGPDADHAVLLAAHYDVGPHCGRGRGQRCGGGQRQGRHATAGIRAAAAARRHRRVRRR
jgi:hypothetical protein